MSSDPTESQANLQLMMAEMLDHELSAIESAYLQQSNGRSIPQMRQSFRRLLEESIARFCAKQPDFIAAYTATLQARLQERFSNASKAISGALDVVQGHLGDEDKAALLARPLIDIEFSDRLLGIFEAAGMITVQDLVLKGELELLDLSDLTGSELTEVKEKLALLGLKLGFGSVDAIVVLQTIDNGPQTPVPTAFYNAISVRARKALSNLNAESLEKLKAITRTQLRELKNCGAGTVEEIAEKLHQILGIDLLK